MATKKKQKIDVMQIWLTKIFNEWMRRYIDDPKGFEAEFVSVIAFKDDDDIGKVPSYGSQCAAYVVKISAELAAKASPRPHKSTRRKRPAKR